MEPIENNSQHEMQREYIDISVLSSEEMQYITYVVRMIIDPFGAAACSLPGVSYCTQF